MRTACNESTDVDDEQVIGDALASRLRSDHLEVATRTNGRDALKSFEVWSPDLVVLVS